MAYNEFIADRIRQIFRERKTNFYEKRMMGGLCFMVDDKMCCGVHYSKKKETDLLMTRIGEDAYEQASKKEGALPMDFTGRPMKGFVFVTPDGFDMDKDLEYWVDLCLAFNPIAKRSKKK